MNDHHDHHDEQLEPLPRDIEELLDRERKALVVPPLGLEQAVLASVVATVAAGPGAAPGSAGGAATSGAVHATVAGKIASGVALFVLGGLAGAGGHALYVRESAPIPSPAPVIQVVQRAAPRPTPPPEIAAPVPVAPAPPEVAVVAPVAAPQPRAKPAPHSQPVADKRDADPAPGRTYDTALAAERGVLEVARMALAKGQADGAITELEKHARLYPKGQLVEEREALWVVALVNAGRYPEARAKGRQFAERYPTSMSLPTVQETLKSIP